MTYKEMMNQLRRVNGMVFTHNPGGGEFFKPGHEGEGCQIHCQDDKADYKRLWEWHEMNLKANQETGS